MNIQGRQTSFSFIPISFEKGLSASELFGLSLRIYNKLDQNSRFSDMKICHEGNFPEFFIARSKELCIKEIADHFPISLVRVGRFEKSNF